MANTKRSFAEWKKEVDNLLIRKVSLCSEDLPDWCYYESYQNGDSPSQAAKDALTSAQDF